MSTVGKTVEDEEVAEESGLIHFSKKMKSMFRWKGSVFSAVWIEFIAFLAAYLSISLGYNSMLSDDAKRLAIGDIMSNNPADDYDDEPRWFRFGKHMKNMLRWNGSVYSYVWLEFIAFVIIYLLISFGYNFLLNEDSKRVFEGIAEYCSKFTSTIPIVLLLGFFTSTAMQRSFTAMSTLPGCSRVITIFATTLKESQQNAHEYVRMYARWIVLSWTLAFLLICGPLRKKFPNLKSLVDAELLASNERIELEKTLNENDHPLIVLDWCISLLKQCRSNMEQPVDFNRNVEAILLFKKTCGNTLKFARKSIPFAMTQTVSIAVYMFIASSLLSRLVEKNPTMNIMIFYVPLINICQCFLYYLWMKFGRSAANPFGSGPDDIDVTSFLKNHLDAAARLVGQYSTLEVNKNLILQSLSQCPNPSWMGKFERPLPVVSINGPALATATRRESKVATMEPVYIQEDWSEFDYDSELHF